MHFTIQRVLFSLCNCRKVKKKQRSSTMTAGGGALSLADTGSTLRDRAARDGIATIVVYQSFLDGVLSDLVLTMMKTK
ncbi:hypothetical protein Y032_0002g510 [Ancylostoma ceylanicum]|uniref:Uncharacterized protein n=1 Tax=Ancylostoma ceylanicum TaxID=53326 RepID=A0A016W0W1_9BILA|nr:hypothetical protein Y032_0002g510 [Ancylostoma ceylanicum]